MVKVIVINREGGKTNTECMGIENGDFKKSENPENEQWKQNMMIKKGKGKGNLDLEGKEYVKKRRKGYRVTK